MNTYAVIDIGSNSVRLMFVANGKVLYKRLNTTRLGESLAQTGVLSSAAIARSVEALADFYARAKDEGAEETFAFATAAVRSARNGVEFTQAVYARCGLQIEVLSGNEEAEIGILGALGYADGGVIDVGGASTELVLQRGGRAAYKKSVNVGVVRLKDLCKDYEALQAYTATAAGDFSDAPRLENVYAIGGTATTLAALALGLEKYDSEKITGATLSQEKMHALVQSLSKKTVEEIAAMPCVPAGRADVLLGGAVWLSAVMQALDIRRLIVSDRDNLEGYALKKGLQV